MFPKQLALILLSHGAVHVLAETSSRNIVARSFSRDVDLYANWPSYDELPLHSSYPTKAAWGVWGSNDQRGALNHITNETVLAASKEISEGLAIPINLPLDMPSPPPNPSRKPLEHLFQPGDGYVDDVVVFNTQIGTQFDGLRHFPYSTDNNISTYQWYNDLIGNLDDVIGPKPSTPLGLQVSAEKGIAVRGVLLDFAGWKDSREEKYDAFSAYAISTEELDAIADWQGLPEDWSKPGDMLLIRTGWTRRYRSLNDTEKALLPLGDGASAGMEASSASARWLWNKKLSLVGADNVAFETVREFAGDHFVNRKILIFITDTFQWYHRRGASVTASDLHWRMGPEHRRTAGSRHACWCVP